MTLRKVLLYWWIIPLKLKILMKFSKPLLKKKPRNLIFMILIRKYGPRLISIGEGWVLKGLDEALASANSGDKLSVEITPDKGFGERDPSKVK